MLRIPHLALVCLCVTTAFGQNPLQKAVESSLQHRTGSVVVLEIRSGKVIASKNLDLAATKLASPGSTIKPFILAALLQSSGFDPRARIMCRRKLTIGTHKLDCSHPLAPPQLNAGEALAYSCNTYFADVSKRLSKETLVRELRKRGFTSPTRLAQGENVGVIRSPGNEEDARLLALGADLIEVTPLEMALAYRNLALEMDSPSSVTAATIAYGLRAATEYGMAANAKNDAVSVAGKTGTASARGTQATHGWFVGLAPADKPEIVVVIFLEQGRGLEAAAFSRPIFQAFAAHRKLQ